MNKRTQNKLLITAIILSIIFVITMGLIDVTSSIPSPGNEIIRAAIITIAVLISIPIVIIFLWYWISELIWDDLRRKRK